MPTWLSDPSNTFYILALVIALVAVGLWVHKKDRPNLVRAAVVVGLVALVFLIDLGVESPREESVRKTKEMVQAANERKWDQMAAHMSDQFEWRKRKKDSFRTDVADNATRFNVTVNVKDFNRDTVKYSADGNSVDIGFVAQATVPGMAELVPYYVVAKYGKDPDGQFRLRTFTVYEFVDRTKEANIPHLP